MFLNKIFVFTVVPRYNEQKLILKKMLMLTQIRYRATTV
jgi:hypothetical protein